MEYFKADSSITLDGRKMFISKLNDSINAFSDYKDKPVIINGTKYTVKSMKGNSTTRGSEIGIII